jgi:hypothetical protein
MRLIIVFWLVFCAPAAFADSEHWTTLSGEGISEALTGRIVQYPTATQDFRVSGRTLYNAGRDSWGYWEVRGSQYCSLWPPQDLWACYDMQQQGDKLRFIGAGGDVTDGMLVGTVDQQATE